MRYSSGNAPLAKAIKQPSWQQITDQRTKKRQRPRHIFPQERTKPQLQNVGTGVAELQFCSQRDRLCGSRLLPSAAKTVASHEPEL